MECLQKWKEIDRKLETDGRIDQEQRIFNLKRQHWRGVMKRITAVIQLCANQMLILGAVWIKFFNPITDTFEKI